LVSLSEKKKGGRNKKTANPKKKGKKRNTKTRNHKCPAGEQGGGNARRDVGAKGSFSYTGRFIDPSGRRLKKKGGKVYVVDQKKRAAKGKWGGPRRVRETPKKKKTRPGPGEKNKGTEGHLLSRKRG